jgi:hypothetical protein
MTDRFGSSYELLLLSPSEEPSELINIRIESSEIIQLHHARDSIAIRVASEIIEIQEDYSEDESTDDENEALILINHVATNVL